jgi:hypothetical protein
MGNWIEWIEPFGPNNEPVYCRVTEETAIAHQKKIGEHLKKPYLDDQRALEDFIIVRWADVIKG